MAADDSVEISYVKHIIDMFFRNKKVYDRSRKGESSKLKTKKKKEEKKYMVTEIRCNEMENHYCETSKEADKTMERIISENERQGLRKVTFDEWRNAEMTGSPRKEKLFMVHRGELKRVWKDDELEWNDGLKNWCPSGGVYSSFEEDGKFIFTSPQERFTTKELIDFSELYYYGVDGSWWYKGKPFEEFIEENVR